MVIGKNIINKSSFIVLVLAGTMMLTACQNGRVLGQQTDDINGNKAVKAVPGQIAMIDYDIIVTKPLSDEVIGSPIQYSGRTMEADKPVLVRLIDIYNNVLATSTATINNDGSFSGQMSFPVAYSQQGRLEAYSLNMADNTVSDLMKVPVNFRDYVEPKVTVYFSNILKDPDLKECGTVYPVEREIIPDRSMLEILLTELLKGVNEEEAKAGYVSNIPEEGVKIQGINYEDSKLLIDFNQALQQDVKGACRVAAIRAQITETLKQFHDVSEVVISIDGKTDGILKP